MRLNEIKKILKENKDVFEALENYDETGKLLFQGKELTSHPISQIIEEKIN